MELTFWLLVYIVAPVFAIALRHHKTLIRHPYRWNVTDMGHLKFAPHLHRKGTSSKRSGEIDVTIPYEIDVKDIAVDTLLSNPYPVSFQQRNKRSRPKHPSSFKPDKQFTRYFKFQAFGRTFFIEVFQAPSVYPSVYEVDYKLRNESLKHFRWSNNKLSCQFWGKVLSERDSKAAINICDGFRGVIYSNKKQYYIEPKLHKKIWEGDIAYPHVIYTDDFSAKAETGWCSVQDEDETWRAKEHDTYSKTSHSSHSSSFNAFRYQSPLPPPRVRRSVSTERYVETLVVADQSMVAYHTKEHIENYITSVMNVVAKLYRDASIGNSINIIVSRIIILQEDQKDLIINNHADETLKSFCKWQQLINPRENGNSFQNTGIAHHDNAILLTRLDICSHSNEPCGTLGLAPVSGMCEPDRSCSIVQDIGLATAFTIAHEMGHNFGMQHDGSGNDCGVPGSGKAAKLMARQLTESTDPFTWSQCSEQYISDFLDSGRGMCLNNEPPHNMYQSDDDLPGRLAGADVQCKWQFDATHEVCDIEKICSDLHCRNVFGECVTNNIPAADGTSCFTQIIQEGWCIGGECVEQGQRQEPVDGHWGQWSSWNKCSRTCGGGVASSMRGCTNPRPQNGGRFCIGERKRYRSCNIQDCAEQSPGFRELQCSQYDRIPFRGRFYTWRPFIGGAQIKPCALSCLAEGYNFYTERAPKVIDGTRCYPDLLDVCINGECMHVGCDRMLGSNAEEDVCRVCNGDGSSCVPISGEVRDPHAHLADSYKDIIRIPKGAVNIMVKEKVISRNYLVLQTADDGEYHINGGWTIDWPRTVEAANTVFQYDRPKRQTESLYALGPISQEIIIHLLLQEENLGIEYSYHMPKHAEQLQHAEINRFAWRFLPWSSCSQSCATGSRVALAVCMRLVDLRTVGNEYCATQRRPEDKRQDCNTQNCPSQWRVDVWSSCSKSCGTGTRTREVACIQLTIEGEKVIDQSRCMGRKPRNRSRCHREECPPHWIVDVFSQCDVTCGEGIRKRNTYCLSSIGNYLADTECDAALRPANTEACFNYPCPVSTWVVGAWHECSSQCGRGMQMRDVSCTTSNGESSMLCMEEDKPDQIRECNGPCLPVEDGDCMDISKVEYCPLVLQFKFCDRPYFYHMCCETCRAAGFSLERRFI